MEDMLQLGLDPYAPLRAGSKAPLSEEDWKKRLQTMRDLGMKEDGVLMRGTEWRRGLAADREALRSELRDRVGRSLGFKGQDATAMQAAGATASR